ncbi:MAG: tetratricopeptide repeat protein [Bradymonadia bacterium]
MITRHHLCLGFMLSVLISLGTLQAAEELPKDSLTDEARTAYNAGKYDKAVSLFKQLTFKHSRSPAIYRALAASANNAKQYAVAVRAYTIYLQLAGPGSDADKARAELKNVQQQLKSSKASSKKQKQLKDLEQRFEQSLKTKTLDGKKGALTLLKALMELDFFGPKYAEYQSTLLDQLDSRLDDVLSAFWSVKKTVDAESILNLQGLVQAGNAVHLNPSRLNRIARMTKALASWSNGETNKALQQLNKVQHRDYRLRYLQAHLLFKAKRYKESERLFRSLYEQFRHPRMLLRAEQIRLKKKRKLKDEDLDALVEILDGLPDETQ